MAIYIYLHNWVIFTLNLGKSSSNMEQLGMEFVGYLNYYL